jgi:hypothetical protein
MKFTAIGILSLALAVSSFAQTPQNPDPSKWMCRNLADSGGFFYQGETIFGSKACRPIPQTPVANQQVAMPSNQAPITQPVATAPTSEPSSMQSNPTPTPPVQPPPVQPTASTKHDKPIVFLNGTGNTQTAAGRGLFGTTWASTSQHDQTMEMAKDFNECQGVRIVLNQENADYSVFLNHEGNNHNQMALTNATGEILMTDTAHGLHQSVKNKVAKFCSFILNDWNNKYSSR